MTGRIPLLSLLLPFSALALSCAGAALPGDGLSVSTERVAAATPVCDARSFGAQGDGRTKDTFAIQAAIDHCAGGGGGTVLLRGGVFLSGMITLKSGIHLSIAPDATLRGTQDDSDYPDTHPPTDNSQLSNCRKTLIYAEGARDIAIEGGGTLDGNGNTPKWIGGASVHPERTRPMIVYTTLSSGVTIQNLHVRDAAMWAVVSLEDDDVTVRGLDVRTPLSGTRDGIDVVDCHHVLIENNTIYSEDDSICLKSGTAKGVEDVVVRGNHVLRSIVANGLKLGTASTGSFKNVLFEDNVIDSADKAALAVESVDGAAISGVTFRRIRFRDTGASVFVLLGRRGSPTGKVGSIDGVRFEDIEGEAPRHSWGSVISGTVLDGVRHAPTNIDFVNVHIAAKGGLGTVPPAPPEYDGRYPDPNLWGNVPASGYFIRHVDGIRFTGSTVTVSPADARAPVVQEDVTGYSND